MKKRILSLLLTVIMITGMIPLTAINAFAADTETIEFLCSARAFGEDSDLFYNAYHECKLLEDDEDNWDETWYVVRGNVTIEDWVDVETDVNLVLEDGSTLICEEGIDVDEDNSLTIYAQSTGDNKGKIFAYGWNYSAGIGSAGIVINDDICGDITIHGGYIEAKGTDDSAGIGGGQGVNSAAITIYGGEIKATGGCRGPGIGGGMYGACHVYIYGGDITATGGLHSCGIGSGGGVNAGTDGGSGGEVYIYGGNVTAYAGPVEQPNEVYVYAGYGGAGIGGGFEGDGCDVRVYGGNVTAYGSVNSPGIGGGSKRISKGFKIGGGTFTMWGGTVTAVGGTDSAAIGGGYNGNGADIKLYGGEIYASTQGYTQTFGRGTGGESDGSVSVGTGLAVFDASGQQVNGGFEPMPLSNSFFRDQQVCYYTVRPYGDPVSYLGYNSRTGTIETQSCSAYTYVNRDVKDWKDGWYVFNNTGTFNTPVTVTGDVNLIIEDGKTMNAASGIQIKEGATLNIYSQSDGASQGKLFITGATDCAGIGSRSSENSGTFSMNGCDVTVYGGRNSAAIGGGYNGNAGTLILNGGILTAEAGAGAKHAIGAGVGGTDNGEIKVFDTYTLYDTSSQQIITKGPDESWVRILNGSKVSVNVKPMPRQHDDAPIAYKYYNENAELTEGVCTEYLPLYEGIEMIPGGWYTVDGDLTLNKRVNVGGDVNLILPDDCKLILNDGLRVGLNSTLTIYGQTYGTGELIAEDASHEGISVKGTLNIHGGTITATGVEWGCPGIDTSEGILNILDGTVTANGGSRAPGIGGGAYKRDGGNINIKGGTVTAIGGYNAAGIGGATGGDGGNITIDGGMVTANGGNFGAGIGGGDEGGCGTITINGGDIIAISGAQGAGIGCGRSGDGGTITVTDGIVNARSLSAGTGIGGNSSSISKTAVYIYGGDITADSFSSQDAISAHTVVLYPDQCESFAVMNEYGEVTDSPYTAQTDICSAFAGHHFAHIESKFKHDFVDHSCTICGAAEADAYTVSYNLNYPSEHLTAENGSELATKARYSSKKDIAANGLRMITQTTTIPAEPNARRAVGIDDYAWFYYQNRDTQKYTKLFFKGWNTKADGSGMMYAPGDKPEFREETELYAIWEALYEIRYHQDYIDLDREPLGVVTGIGTIGTKIIVPEGTQEGQLDYLLPAGYDSGYQKNKAGGYVDVIKEDGSAYVDVLYLNTATISYQIADECAGMGSVTLTEETLRYSKGVLKSAKGSTAEAVNGYRFVKWIDADGETVCDTPEFVPENLTGPNVFSAVFEECPITYELNFPQNLSYQYDIAKVGYGSFITVANPFYQNGLGYLKEYAAKSENGIMKYRTIDGSKEIIFQAYNGKKLVDIYFCGWNTEPDGSGEMYTVGDFPTITGPSTFYAIWSLTSPESGKLDPGKDKEKEPTQPSDPTNPHTGDNSHMILEIVLATISGIGICICLMVGKKKRHAK